MKISCSICNRDTGINSEKKEFCKGCGKFTESCDCSEYPEKVSIVIPVYNGEKYINEAIKNVLRQDYENYEVIVVDDGSTDKTLLNIERDPLSKNIKIIEKENGGVGSALNAGIKAMTGNWFKWLSADDVLEINCLSRMMNTIKKTENNTEKIFYTHYDIIDEDNELIVEFEEQDRNKFTHEEKCAELLKNYYGNGTTCMIHKSVFDRVGYFDESLKNGEDYDFWLRCVLQYDIDLYLIPENLAKYRKHRNQLTNRMGTQLFKNVQKIRENNIAKMNNTKSIKVMEIHSQITKKPMKVKMRRTARDILFTILPNSINNKILSSYMSKKKNDKKIS